MLTSVRANRRPVTGHAAQQAPVVNVNFQTNSRA